MNPCALFVFGRHLPPWVAEETRRAGIQALRYIVPGLLSIGTCCPAFGQRWSQHDWSELRRRLENNLDVRDFFRAYPVWQLSLDQRQQAVQRIACGMRISPSLALSLIEQESGFRQVKGEAGELGAAQVRPDTARQYDLDRERLANDYAYAVTGGLTILKSLLVQFSGSERAALAAYNGGPAYQSSPPQVQERVRRYVAEVLARKSQYAGVQCD